MTGLRISALIVFILSHLSLAAIFVFENELQNVEFPYIFIIWGLGILSAGLNIYYAAKIKLKAWVLFLLALSGIIWFFPQLLFSFFGIPCLSIFLVTGIYSHSQKLTELNKNLIK